MANTRPHAVDPSTATARAILVYKTTDYDSPSHVGLGVIAASTAKTLRANSIWAEAWGCTDSANLRARLDRACAVALQRGQLQPTHVVIHAPWVSTDHLAEMARDFPDIVFAVVSHSNFGFLAADPHAVQLLRQAVELQHSLHNVVVAGNSDKFACAASVIWNTKVAFLPNLYDLSEPMPTARPAWSGDGLRLGLFGACRLLKNGLTAAAAAASLSATLRVPTQLYVSEKNQARPEPRRHRLDALGEVPAARRQHAPPAAAVVHGELQRGHGGRRTPGRALGRERRDRLGARPLACEP